MLLYTVFSHKSTAVESNETRGARKKYLTPTVTATILTFRPAYISLHHTNDVIINLCLVRRLFTSCSVEPYPKEVSKDKIERII